MTKKQTDQPQQDKTNDLYKKYENVVAYLVYDENGNISLDINDDKITTQELMVAFSSLLHEYTKLILTLDAQG